MNADDTLLDDIIPTRLIADDAVSDAAYKCPCLTSEEDRLLEQALLLLHSLGKELS